MKLSSVALISLIVLLSIIRVVLISQVDAPAYDAYYSLRHIESIRETGLPLLYDDLSYQGRDSFATGISYYFMTLFSFLFGNQFLLQYVNVLLFAGMLVCVYFISRELSLSRWLSVLVTFLFGTSSQLFFYGANTLIPGSFFILFLLLLLYAFFKGESVLFLVSAILLILTSSLALVVLLGFVIYLLITHLEQLKIKKKEFELLFFSIVFGLWYNLLIYKTLLFDYGSQAIWATIPVEVQSQLFQSINAPVLLAFVGSIPLLLGVYGAYSSLFEQRNRKQLFIVSLALSFGALTWLSLIPLALGLLYTSLCLVLMSGYGATRIKLFFSKTIIGKARLVLVGALVVLTLIGFGSLVFSNPLVELAPTTDELAVMEYVGANTEESSVVLGSITDGHLISGVAGRVNVFDEEFTFAPQAQIRYNDVRNIYLSKSVVGVLNQLQNYNVDYVYISDNVRIFYPAESYLFEDNECFSPYYESGSAKVYTIKCYNVVS